MRAAGPRESLDHLLVAGHRGSFHRVVPRRRYLIGDRLSALDESA
jgi:hypothetical protein